MSSACDPVELKKLVKQLQNLSSPKEIVDLLGLLKKDFKVNEQVLRESKAGLAVGKLRQHASKDVADAAKELVKLWKGEVEKAKQGGAANGKAAVIKTSASTPTVATPNSSKTDARSAKIDGARLDVTGDKTRDKCIELIYDALAKDSAAPTDLISQRAIAVEVATLNLFGSPTAEYKSKIRTLFVNLKDNNNPGLRTSVVSGEISAEKLSTMSSSEMASAERKAADERIKEENLFKSLGAGEQQAETDAFQCGRCKQRKCRYRQAQTRSADEPMTTFVTCTNCGHRWKFS
ncbi:transcription elongation factor [Dendrothele bispora CBS 962.96]|uniref:Transcription elongation factor n=1 Tax=Dendrothele bispora (strain CBS 962.96) TaxID=1314807 RepID=A0A4S8M8Y2_DENBC|nr:transcription elongation factor [Dendrothele bispora CBS 962.96]